MASVGFVLGAGGAVGMAWHAGVVAAFSEATSFDARDADLVVGTSAGSVVAASLRAGLAPADHHARATSGPLSPAGEALTAELPEQADLPLYPLRNRGLPLPASPTLLFPAFVRRGTPRPGLALAGLLPRGQIETTVIGHGVDAMYEQRWPDRPTWICAVDLASGRRVVFGRDDVAVPSIGRAVEASAAIPGFFRPVEIGNRDYVDGGVYSATNADLVASLGLDLVVISSPMSASRGALRRSVAAGWRAVHAIRLRGEVEAVKKAGTHVLVLQPGSADLEQMGSNPMDRSRRAAVSEQARESAHRRLERVDDALLALLNDPERARPT